MGIFKRKSEIEKLYEEVYKDIYRKSFIQLEKKNKSTKGTCLINKGDVDLILCFYENGMIKSFEDSKVRDVLNVVKKHITMEELFSKAASNSANIIYQLYHIKTGHYAFTNTEEKDVRRLNLPSEISMVFDVASIMYAKEYFIRKGKKSITKDFKKDAIICIPTKSMILYGDSNNKMIKRNMISYMEKNLSKKEKLLSNKFYKYDEANNLTEVGEFELFKKHKS